MTSIYADAHVHIHDCFDVDRLLGAALERAAELGGPLLLLLSEGEGDDYFERFRQLAQRTTEAPESGDRAAVAPSEAASQSESDGANPRRANREPRPRARAGPSARIGRTAEPHSLAIDRGGASDARLYLVAGRQKVSAERIEVLALCLDPGDPLRGEPDGALSTEQLVRRTLEAGAVAVLPWGFGKWIGPRGAAVAKLARTADLRDHPRFFLGDIAHRCWPWPTPEAFRAGNRVLPGTDPLPLPGIERGIARYGFRVKGEWEPDRPVASLFGALEAGCEIEPVGRPDSPWATLGQQLRYRMGRA